MFDIDSLTYNEAGLIPAILIDNTTNEVLMMAWMNKESIQKTFDSGLACFWSRSRQELWTKGETSGNLMHVVTIHADCDADTLLVRVNPDGPACHTGEISCFFQPVFDNSQQSSESACCVDAQDEACCKAANEQPTDGDNAHAQADWQLNQLYQLLEDRKRIMPEGSYTSYLFEKGLDKILKKVGEESTEVIIAAKAKDRDETIYELADLAYHALVLMVNEGIALKDVSDELERRHVIDKKVKQEHMTGN